MSSVLFDAEKCILCRLCVEQCPFGSLSVGKAEILADETCRMCGVCVKICPQKALTFTQKPSTDLSVKQNYQGILVYAQQELGELHPITLEMIGEARKLAAAVDFAVYAVIVGGEGTQKNGQILLDYGVTEVFSYEHPGFEGFKADCYTDAVADCIAQLKPSSVLIGGTPVGRSLAPRLSARFRTGLTADCTKLEMEKNTDLVQIRPAFGGNIMAKILITQSRPQFATIRYQVMDKAEKVAHPTGILTPMPVSEKMVRSRISLLSTQPLPSSRSIEEEEILVVAGRGLKNAQGVALAQDLADLLGGQLCFTRPMAEAGLGDPKKQVGLSGRTVRPKLILTCGVSGAVQFVAGMSGSDCIVAINADPEAPIFNVANYGVPGDAFQILPALIAQIRAGKPIPGSEVL